MKTTPITEYQLALIDAHTQTQDAYYTAIDAMWESFKKVGEEIEAEHGLEALATYLRTCPECAPRTFALIVVYRRIDSAKLEMCVNV